MGKAINIEGLRFGRLVVVKRCETPITVKGKDIYWLCRCDCGVEIAVRSAHLRSGATRSCSCLSREMARHKDLSGQRFGYLLAIQAVGRLENNVVWLCSCDCGKTAKVRAAFLLGGRTRSCGCLVKKTLVTHGMSYTKQYGRHRSMKRWADRLQRTPKWANLDEIREFYSECPEGYQVDHIIPIRGKLVSGLHILSNLQYLPKSTNRRKSNKFQPILVSADAPLITQPMEAAA